MSTLVLIIPREILPDVWHWRIPLDPDVRYVLVGRHAHDRQEIVEAIRAAEGRERWPIFDEYSRVWVPADPSFHRSNA